MSNGKSSATLPISNPNVTSESKSKKKKKKGKGGNVNNHDDLVDEEVIENIPRLPNLTPQDFTNGRFNLNTPTGLNQAQSDLLATANDLYRQIESAAAAALAGHLPPTGNLPARGEETTDDAYWSSLPHHLRSFIRSALPLAAGLTPGSNANGNPALNLTPEQMQQAAHQLAQVVQSAGWSGLGTGNPNPPAANFQANGTRATTGATIVNGSATTTIPLGSFTLPLIPHPDVPESQYMSNENFDDEDEGDMSETEQSVMQESKSKKKKKKKKVSISYYPWWDSWLNLGILKDRW